MRLAITLCVIACLSDYQPHDGMLIPRTGEAAWLRAEGRKAYFVGHIKKLSYEFLP